jgi:hypothetical protein
MPGIRHVRHLADIEALQDLEYILRPGGGSFGRRVRASVHFDFQSVGEAVFRGRLVFRGGTIEPTAFFERAKTAYRSLPVSMAA